MILYHFTSPFAALIIVRGGGFTGEVWLSPDPAITMGEDSRTALLEVVLPDEVARPFVQAVQEETIDPETDEPIPDDGNIPPFTWYCIPAAVVNSSGKVRMVGALPPS
jgi:hypothetical protein